MKKIVKKPDGWVTVEESERLAPRADGEVVVDVSYAGICRTDLQAASGRLLVPDGLTLGHEFCGRISAVGSGVPESLPVGTPVSADPTKCGSDGNDMLGVQTDGCFAEQVRLPWKALVRLPDETMLTEVGAFVEPVAAALAPVDRLNQEEKILVFGSGRIAELEAALLDSYGFQNVSVGCFPDPVSGYDAIVETLPEAISYLVRAMSPGCRLIVKSRVPKAQLSTFDVRDLVMSEKSIIGVWYGSFGEAVSVLTFGQPDVRKLFEPRTFSLDEAEEALALAESQKSKKVFFKIGG